MLQHWRTLSSRAIHENPWWTYRLDDFEIPGRVKGQYHYVHTAGSSMVVPLTDDGRIIMVNQYRYLGRRESVEFPCGSLQHGRTYPETAHLELREETGYAAKTLEPVGRFNPYNGVTDEMCEVFVATGLSPTQAQPDATEEFEVVACRPAELEAFISQAKVWDGMTLAAWALARETVFGRLG